MVNACVFFEREKIETVPLKSCIKKRKEGAMTRKVVEVVVVLTTILWPQPAISEELPQETPQFHPSIEVIDMEVNEEISLTK